MQQGDLWIADDVLAYVENGKATISVGRASRALPKAKAYRVADQIWYAGQLQRLELAIRRGKTAEIPLTDRRRRSSLRLGGGFLMVQGTRIILFRRTMDAPRSPSQLCECGGIYEVSDKPDPLDISNDLIASLLKECAELALVRGDRLYVPRLATGPAFPHFEPPDVTFSDYDNVLKEELLEESLRANLPVCARLIETPFYASILNYEHSAALQFANSPAISVVFTAELDRCSLEFAGVLSLPENLDRAALAYLEAEPAAGPEAKAELENEVASSSRPPLEYWDTERADGKPLDREIHLIDIRTAEDDVWHTPAKSPRTRQVRRSTLRDELSRTHLSKTGGRYATEKAEKAIKMHAPLPWLEPLITL